MKTELPYNPEQVRDMVASMYKNQDGTPHVLVPSQIDIFAEISMRLHPRVHCMTHTRFGKSETAGLAVLTRVASFPEKWAIVSGSKEKAKIIMNYVIAHIFDNEFTAARFRLDKGDSAEAIKRHRNKNHLTFDVGNGLISELFIGSAKEAIGFGAPNVLADEASLIDDPDWALVMRMLNDNPDDNFLFEIGNPFRRNHFLDESEDPLFHKINIDCYKGMKEGRLTQEAIDEAKKYKFFSVLYENKFPRAEDVDEKGWSYLIPREDLQGAIKRFGSAEHYGIKRLGLDVARSGRNFNAWVLRGDNYAKLLRKSSETDLMEVARLTKNIMKEHGIDPKYTFVDDTGMGGGVTDRLKEDGIHIIPVVEGAAATEVRIVREQDPKDKTKFKDVVKKEYANMRAQIYAGSEGLSNWLKRQGSLEDIDIEIDNGQGWDEALEIRYKKNDQGLTVIESKIDMRARGVESPDVIDALALTFAPTAVAEPVKTFHAPDPTAMLQQGERIGFGINRRRYPDRK